MFADLVGKDAKQLHYTLVKDGEIEVVGKRFSVRAVEDDKRDDTLFVCEVGPAKGKEGRKVLESKWLLAKGDRWEVKGNPIRLDRLRPPASAGPFGTIGTLVGNLALGPTLDVALKALVVPWSADWLKAVPPLGPLDANAALARLSQRYQQHPDLFSHLAGNPREGQILHQKVSKPVDAPQIAESFIARIGLPWLEKVYRSTPSRLPEAVGSILSLPPHVEVLRRLIKLWLSEASTTDFPGHLAATASWLDAAPESVNRDRWIQLLKEIHAHRVKTRGIPVVNGGANIAGALASWETLRQWAKAERPVPAAPPAESPSPVDAPVVATVKAAETVAPEVAPGARAEAEEPARKADEVPPAPAVPTPSPAAPAPADQREELMRRLATLHYQGVLAARPNLFSAGLEITQRAQDLAAILHGLPGSEALRKAREALDAIARAAEGATSKLPTYEDVYAGDLELGQTVQALNKLIPTGPGPWVQGLGSWSELQELLRVLGSPALDLLPAWLYQDLAPEEADSAQARIRAATGATRSALRDVLEWIEGLPAPDASLLVQTSRAEGPDPLGRLKQALEVRKDEELLQGRLAPLEAQHGPWVRQLFDGAHADMTVADAANSVEILVQQFELVAAEAPALRAEIVTWLGMMGSLREAHDFVQRLEKELKLLGPATLEHLKTVDAVHAVAARLGPASAMPAAVGTDEAAILEIDHCVSGEKGVQAARLMAGPHPSTAGMYVTDVPLNLKSSSRAPRKVTLDVDAPHLVNRPSEWSKRLKGLEYQVSEDDWYELDSGKYAASIVLEAVPVTQQRRDGSQLLEIVLKIRGHDDLGGQLKERDLHFAVPEFAQLSIELPEEGDTVPTARMRQYPLGIQVHFEQILKTVREGSSSFLLAAPRRFGKTTLLRALEEELRQSDIFVIKPDAATPETSIRDKFVEVCELLGKQLGAHVSTSWSSSALLPPGDAFDAARAAALKQGKRAIYVLLDESQALFAHKRGKEAAEQMKIRIDGDWGVAKPGMAPIRFGLIGQLHLTRQLAGQLDGVFARNWRESEFQPDMIERMLRGQTKDRMQSTRDARRLLSEAARNFHILRALLDEIRRIMIAKQRAWFLTADVAKAMETQLDLAIRLRGPLVSFLLDPLNASENLTVWRPVPAFPVAIAWALALAEENLVPAARLDRARAILNDWVHQSSKRFIVPLPRVEAGLRSLRDLDVLDHDNAFRSRLLERYFLKIGRSKTPLRESEEEQALQSLTIDVVPVPERLEKIGSGGQATVYKGEVEGKESAVRVMELSERDHRITFIETCYALKAIEVSRRPQIGFFSLPAIRQAGLAPGIPARGVIIYDFVHGSDLTTSCGQLEEPVVVSIGRALAEALSVLDQRGVVHRDIRADNVVLQPSGVPVLVDFGLARLLGASPVTPLHHPGIAPEAAKGIWTSKADVFALSWMLESLLTRPDPATQLGKVLQEARIADHLQRSSPSKLADQLRGLADQLNLESKRYTLEAEMGEQLRAVKADVVQKIGEAHLPSMVATVAGFFRRLGMLQHVAHFLDDLLSDRTGRHLTNLALGKGPDPVPKMDALRQKESTATGHLRHSFAHGNSQEDNLQKAANILGVPSKGSYEPLKHAVLITAQRLEQVLPAPGLHAFTANWIKRCEPAP